jgi:hypothetical protein
MVASVRERLAAGPARGLGCANAVAAEALLSPMLVADMVEALGDERGVVVVRAANALKKVQAEKAELVAPFAKKILRAAMECEELFAQWSLTIVVGGLPLRGRDKALAVELMFEALRSQSGLLRTMAMQALVDLSADDAALRRRVRPIVEEFRENGTAAMRARARKLSPLFMENHLDT